MQIHKWKKISEVDVSVSGYVRQCYYKIDYLKHLFCNNTDEGTVIPKRLIQLIFLSYTYFIVSRLWNNKKKMYMLNGDYDHLVLFTDGL